MESLSSPVSGTVKNLTEVRDEVFATDVYKRQLSMWMVWKS